MSGPEKRPIGVISTPPGFRFGPVPPDPKHIVPAGPPPPLGAISAFVGNWMGNGFNTIFRPDNAQTPTALNVPVPVSDNVLELNLTSESLSFSPSLGAVPNRGSNPQGDIFLNGVPYLQAISDITLGAPGVGIHVEPGIWIAVPATANPLEGPTFVRMASIPHGTTIEAQGTALTIGGPPVIPVVDITPIPIAGGAPIRFPSQTAASVGTPRIPQDLTSFIANGSITQAMLDDPNSFLRDHIARQKITSTIQISVSTKAAAPLIGGGTDNIAFLQPNAQAVQMTATFWIETVEVTILLPAFQPGQPPLVIRGEPPIPGRLAPTFTVKPPFPIPVPRPVTFTFTQIQYSQTVLLNFNGLSWPHVSVATLSPADSIPVTPTSWG